MRLRVTFTILVVIGSYSGTVRTTAQEKTSSPISKPLVAISGTDSHVKELSYERVTTAEDWRRIWARHLGTTVEDAYRAILEVDFDRCLVVVIFRGEQRQVRQITIDSVAERSNAIIVRLSELGYQIMLNENEKPHEPDRPYAFIVLPSTNKEIVVEEEIQNKAKLTPEWKEWVRLKPSQTESHNR